MQDRSKKAKRSRSSVMTVVMAVLVVVIIVIAAVFIAQRMSEEEGSGAPKLHMGEMSHDLGDVPQAPQSTNFDIVNEGDGALLLDGFRTSCDCTQVVLETRGKQSPAFKQTGNPSYQETIKAGDSGTLQVTYDPTYFGDSGPITRYVYFETNDKDHPKVTLTITANVI